MPRKAIYRDANARSAAHYARIRALTPLQRLFRLPEDHLYTERELGLLAEVRQSISAVEEGAGRLNRLVKIRLEAICQDPDLSPDARAEAAVALAAMDKAWRLTLPSF